MLTGGIEMVLGFRKKTEQSQKLVNLQEVYSLWDFLKTKYHTVESLNIYTNFAHDIEFKRLLVKRLNTSRKEIENIEDIIRQYKVHAPKPFRKDIRTSINTEILSDEYIASMLLFAEQELVEMTLKSFASASTNDHVRKFFKEYVFKEINWLDTFIKYTKLKGWIDQPAMYPNIPVTTNEQIDCGEAFQMWDHLTFRYSNIEITEIYHVLARDGDFKSMLKVGIQGILRKEAERLEKELAYFGIPLPKQPKTMYENLGAVELPDETMFKQIFMGMQSAAVVHAQALKQSTTNDRIRTLFSDLLKSEIGTIDNIIKYGKLKGWVEQTPSFSAFK